MREVAISLGRPAGRSEEPLPNPSAPSTREEAFRPLFQAPECGSAEHAQLRSIAGEKDHELQLDALRNFAARQEARGHFTYAASVYEILLEWAEDPQARRRLQALSSGGDFGSRVEFVLSDFFCQASSVEMLGGMAVGSLVGQSLQAFSLSRLLSRDAARFTRGLGARGLASGLGFMGEVPAVVLASKGLRQARGGSVDWDVRTLGHEAMGLGLSLGFLKTGSALTQHALARTALNSVSARLSAALLPGATTVTALFAAHRLESRLGLRPPSDAATALLDSAALLFQFKIGGRFLHLATGGMLARGLSELQVRSRLSEGPRFPDGPQAIANWALAETSARASRRSEFDAALTPAKKFQVDKAQMSSLGDAGGGQEFVYRRLIQRLAQRFGVQESDARLRGIADNYWATPFHHQPANSRGAYFDLLTQTQLQGTRFEEVGREVPAVDLMLSASLVFRQAMEMNPFRAGPGSFYDFMTQVAFEQTVAVRRVPVFDALVHTLTVEPQQRSLENFFEIQDLHHPFTRQRLASGSSSLTLDFWLRPLEDFPVSERSRFWLAEYLVSYQHGLFAKPFRDPTYNYFRTLGPLNRGIRPMLGENVFDSLREIFSNPLHHEVWRKGLHQLAERAEKSAVPLLYFDRFFKLLGSGDIQEKISELVVGTEFNPLELLQMRRLGLPIDGTVYTGYVSDPVLAEKFHRFYQALPELLHPQRSEYRLGEYRAKARSLLDGRENFDRESILELLYHRPTARAAEARQAILDGEIGLEVLTYKGMKSLMQSLRPKAPIARLHDALYLPASRSPSGLPYIAILELDPRLSRDEKIARAPYLAAYAVHEYDHHRHAGEFDLNQRSHRLKAEMRAWVEENLYLLTQGEKTVWEQAESLTPDGFGVYLRSHIEQQYLHEPIDYLQKRP